MCALTDFRQTSQALMVVSTGEGISKDPAQAVVLLTQVASKGHPWGQVCTSGVAVLAACAKDKGKGKNSRLVYTAYPSTSWV